MTRLTLTGALCSIEIASWVLIPVKSIPLADITASPGGHESPYYSLELQESVFGQQFGTVIFETLMVAWDRFFPYFVL